MIRRVAVCACLSLASAAQDAAAADACSTTAIETRAGVSVSDGSEYRVQTWFHTASAAAARFTDADGQNTIVAEGPLGWSASGGEFGLGGEFHRQFALGHQFHALLLLFDDVAKDVRTASDIPRTGAQATGRVGDFPDGGRLYRIDGATPDRPQAIVLERADGPAIVTRFEDWRDHVDGELPFLVVIDDGERQFEYRYESILIEERSPLWFMQVVENPGIDEIALYRLHRQLLAAHCLGDAGMMADLTARESLSVNRGSLSTVSRDEMRTRFETVFEGVEYLAYRDLVEPHITVSTSGDIGWIAVNVEARVRDRASDETGNGTWAWVTLARKEEGRWLHAGNASNRAP